MSHMFTHPFEIALSVAQFDIGFELPFDALAWTDFLLNPRRLRGSDFLMRWSQGVWSERRMIDALQSSHDFFAIPYGPSGTAPTGDVRAFELYFERLEAAGLGRLKRPDLLVFTRETEETVSELLEVAGGVAELPFLMEESDVISALLKLAVVAVECENSLWVAQNMPNYTTPLTAQKRLGGQMGLKKAAVTPTVILKEEDRLFLHRWQEANGVPLHIWHAFYDLAFGISFDDVERLIEEGRIEATKQVFQAPGGATTTKNLYKVYHNYAYALGHTITEPTLVADSITDANGHILPYVRFEGGELQINPQTLDVLKALQVSRQGK